MDTIRLTIDGREIETQPGKSVLEVSLEAGIYIPHLCYHPDLRPTGDCGLCVVEIEGAENLPPACNTPAKDGMIIKNTTEKVVHARRMAIETILAGHPADCGTCIKYLNCELQSLKQYFAIDKLSVDRHPRLFAVNASNPLFTIDPNKCVLCTRCVRACQELRGARVLNVKKNEAGEQYIGTLEDLSLAESGCRFCGACAEVCPTGSIMDKEELTKGKNRKNALIPCRYTCPAEIDVPGYLRFIRDKDYTSAAALIKEKVPFPGVLGYVCDHPCEEACRRGQVNQPISIRDLKRYVVEHIKDDQENTVVKKTATDKKVAVIGSGPAGLTAAYYLTQQGRSVTVFEALPEPGGMLRYGIPAYRLPRKVLDKEIKYVEKLGIEIKTGIRIESLEDLFQQGFVAVLVAIGTHKGQKLNISGASEPGVVSGVDFLRAVNSGEEIKISKNIVVLGGGNVALDCARAALRLGADNVKVTCLESRESMPASEEEIRQGEEEGIVFFPSRTFARIVNEDGVIKGVECLEIESLNFDEEKRPQFETRADSQHLLEGNTVIWAIGQRPDIPENFGLETTSGQLISLDEFTLGTSKEGVFAAGDAVLGTSSVIKAIASGRKTAMAIDRFLEGDGDIEVQLTTRPEYKSYLGPGVGFAGLCRVRDTCTHPDERVKNFGTIVCGMDEKEAEQESGRCLQCDLRMKIKAIKFWSNY